jgi:hypothetical protein
LKITSILTVSAEDTPPQTLTRKNSRQVSWLSGHDYLVMIICFGLPEIFSGARGSKQLADYSCGGSPGLMTPVRRSRTRFPFKYGFWIKPAYRMGETIKQYIDISNTQNHNILIYFA